MQKLNSLIMASAIFLSLASCSDDSGTNNTEMSDDEVLALYAQVYGATNIYIDGDYVVVKSNGVPDHKSPYFQGTTWEQSKYEAYTSQSFNRNPNKIGSQNYVFKIPKHHL